MKKLFVYVGAVLASACMLSSCGNKSCALDAKITSHMDTVGYALGLNQGAMFRPQLQSLPGDSVPVDAFLKGFINALKGDSADAMLSTDETMEILQNYFASLEEIRKQEFEAMKLRNKLAGDSALAANKKIEGVQVTESGLQYKVLAQGEGKKPNVIDTVEVKYTGKLLDGTVFDSSDLHGGVPAKFTLENVIAGWTEGLQLMNEGAKFEFLIPSELAYGENGSRGIEPNSALIFEVELLSVHPAKNAKK